MSTGPLSQCCAGYETEFAVSALAAAGRRIPAPRVSDALVRLAAKCHPNLPSGQDQGVHLGNGGKLYRERGAASDYGLPEWATSECADPEDLVCQAEVGNLLLERLCAHLSEADPACRRATAFRHGVDHINRTSWATHLNVMTSSTIETLAVQLVPHLASKVVFGGAGGFSLEDRRFSLAPRCATIESITSGTTTHNRGLLDTRKLSHCPPGLGRRQHLICFENLCSQLSRYVDAGSTLLILRLIDAGGRPGEKVALADPVGALRLFCTDPRCKAPAKGAQRRTHHTAVAIQRHYLESVRAAIGDGAVSFPSWAGRCCDRWADLLDALESGAPDSVSDRIDWAIKWVLFQGTDKLPLESLLELDIRFGQLDSDGIFRRLDEATLLKHRIFPPERVAQAISLPPSNTRACARGAAISELHSRGERGLAYWDRVVAEDGRVLDLSNPFVSTGISWKSASTPPSNTAVA